MLFHFFNDAFQKQHYNDKLCRGQKRGDAAGQKAAEAGNVQRLSVLGRTVKAPCGVSK